MMTRTRNLKKRKRTGTSLSSILTLRPALLGGFLSAVATAQIQAPVTPPSGAATTRSLRGVVTDDHKNPVSDAVVLLKDTKTLQVRSYLVKKDGAYHFYGLSSDINYEVRAQAGDLKSKPKTVSVFDSHKIVELNLKLNRKKKVQ